MIVVALLVTIIYSVWVINLYLNLTPDPSWQSNHEKRNTSVTLLVPFRNEKRRVLPLLSSIINLKEKYSSIEICFVDDHSSDDSRACIEGFCKSEGLNVRILTAPHDCNGKKDVLAFASQLIKTEWIWLTDADCIIPDHFNLERLIDLSTNRVLVIGQIIYPVSNHVWLEWIRHEALVLAAISHSSINQGHVLMANGGNLLVQTLYYRDVALSGFLNSNEPSGDDVYLAKETIKKGRTMLISTLANDSTIKTQYPNSVKEWLHQRIRWASKKQHNSDVSVFSSGVLILLSNLIVLALLLALPFQKSIMIQLSISLILMIKLCVDFLLVYKTGLILKQKVNVLLVLLLFLTYPFYLLTVSISSAIIKYEWKGRVS